MESKLNLDRSRVDEARHYAAGIADQLHSWINSYTTTTIERAVARLYGIDGVDATGVPLPNVLVEKLQRSGLLEQGLTAWLAKTAVATGRGFQEIAEAVAAEKMEVKETADIDARRWRELAESEAAAAAGRIAARRDERRRMMEQASPPSKPLLYVIVATGNIYEDAVQARAAALQGADVIAVIRHTGQSLLDYVPFGRRPKDSAGIRHAGKFPHRAAGPGRSGMRNGTLYSAGELFRFMHEIAVGRDGRLDILNDAMWILFRISAAADLYRPHFPA